MRIIYIDWRYTCAILLTTFLIASSVQAKKLDLEQVEQIASFHLHNLRTQSTEPLVEIRILLNILQETKLTPADIGTTVNELRRHKILALEKEIAQEIYSLEQGSLDTARHKQNLERYLLILRSMHVTSSHIRLLTEAAHRALAINHLQRLRSGSDVPAFDIIMMLTHLTNADLTLGDIGVTPALIRCFLDLQCREI